jgi:hypothetical protein
MKRVYCAANLPDAHLALHLLESEGIRARVFNENLQGGLGEIPFTHTYPEVWLENERDFARARELIKARELAPADTAMTICAKCGEENPRNFQLCWNCGEGLAA